MRTFNKQQRLALYENAGGRCEICGIQIGKDFHADHIIPYSKGGATDVINGQALCAACNLKKGAKMTTEHEENTEFNLPKSKLFPLRDWQKQCLSRCINDIMNGDHNFLVNACPGAGKTVLALTLAKYLFDEGYINCVVVISPSNNVQSGWVKNAHSHFGINLKDECFLYGDEKEFSGMSMTYQSLPSQSGRIRGITRSFKVLAIIDEIHHCSSANKWGEDLGHALEHCVGRFILTGTPWTSCGNPIPFVKYEDDTKALITGYDYHIGKAIKDDVCRIPMFHLVDINEVEIHDSKNQETISYSSFSDATEDYLENKLYELCRTGSNAIVKLFKSANQELDNLRSAGMKIPPAGLIVAQDVNTAKNYKSIIEKISGESVTIVHSGEQNAQSIIKRFSEGSEKWLIAVDMVSEGVDIPRLQVLIYLHKKLTFLFFMQVLGRIIRRMHSRKTEHEAFVDRYCYFYMLKHSELSYMAKKVEEIITIELDEPKPEPQCKICGNKPVYGGCGEETCPYPGDGPKGPKRFELESDSYADHDAIAEGQEYSSIAVRLVEEACRENPNKRHDRPAMMMMAERMLREMNLNGHEPDLEPEPDLPLNEKKKLIQKEISDIIRKLTVRRVNSKGDVHASDDFKSVWFRINKIVGVKSVNHATYSQLLEMKEVATALLRAVNESAQEQANAGV